MCVMTSLSGASTSSAPAPPVELEDTRVSSDAWWTDFVSSDDQYKLELSGKLVLLAEILKMSESIGDKV